MAAKSGNKRKGTKKQGSQLPERKGIAKEITLLCTLAVCILLFISNLGFGGLAGDFFSSVLFGIFGWMAYLVPVLAFGVIAFLMSNKGNSHAYIKAGATAAFIVLFCAFLELMINQYQPGIRIWEYYTQSSTYKDAGGLLGGLIIRILCPLIGVPGTYVILIMFLLICVILITERSLLKPLKTQSRKVYEGAKNRQKASSTHKKQQSKREKSALEKRQTLPIFLPEEEPEDVGRRRKKFSGVSFATRLTEAKSPEVKELSSEEEPSGTTFGSMEDLSEEKAEQYADIEKQEPCLNDPSYQPSSPEVPENNPAAVSSKNRRTKKKKEQHHTTDSTQHPEAAEPSILPQPEKTYAFPPLSLLTKGKHPGGGSDSQLRATAQKLEETLQNFGVGVRVTNASRGPSVTRYELQPEQGVKVSRIVGLADDIKLNLAVTDLRIEAPIPGKAAVGIEVPNNENTTVMLRDLLQAPEFQRSRSKITFAVGRDIAGKVVVSDIAKMPHLLVAGSTGSGKSVCINTLIMSILYKASPEDVRLIMVDPKVVELSVYNGIPHLLIPVVTDPRKAAGALNWAVVEMEKRYKQFAQYNVRDIKGFNEKIKGIKPGEDVPRKMPQIVIIVDELADLMMVAPKDVENAICRLAQLARAAGIHLVLATQRPSVNVITGLIKANMPSRIAFAVSSGVDSRTIIDMNGAEKLLGKGDMLFYPTGLPKPVRVQGSFVSDQEVQKVVDYLLEHSEGASYNADLEEHMSADPGQEIPAFSDAENESVNERDHYFKDAGMLIIEKEKASIGMLQRMFKIGFNRAARIMDQLGEAGVVGPEEGTKPRKVLMDKAAFEQYLKENK